MKGDYIYCLNPSCNILFKDIDDVHETRDNYKTMCPKCGGTNTINASMHLHDWEYWGTQPRRINITGTATTYEGSELSYRELEQHAEYLQSIGAIKSYVIHKRRGRSKKHFLYDTTDYSNQIRAQALKQNITITYEKPAKPLNKRVPKLAISAQTKPKKPSFVSIDQEVLGARYPCSVVDDAQRHGKVSYCKSELEQGEKPTKIFDSPEDRYNRINKTQRIRTNKKKYRGWSY